MYYYAFILFLHKIKIIIIIILSGYSEQTPTTTTKTAARDKLFYSIQYSVQYLREGYLHSPAVSPDIHYYPIPLPCPIPAPRDYG